jgi:two-component system LytT family response regulator
VSKRPSQRGNGREPSLDRIPIRKDNEVLLVPVREVAAIVAEGANLHVFTQDHECHTMYYRLKDLERRLDPARFVRLGRGTLANVDMIKKVVLAPGGAHVAVLTNGQELPISRLQTPKFRNRLMKL